MSRLQGNPTLCSLAAREWLVLFWSANQMKDEKTLFLTVHHSIMVEACNRSCDILKILKWNLHLSTCINKLLQIASCKKVYLLLFTKIIKSIANSHSTECTKYEPLLLTICKNERPAMASADFESNIQRDNALDDSPTARFESTTFLSLIGKFNVLNNTLFFIFHVRHMIGIYQIRLDIKSEIGGRIGK